jgi:hypothetical protein
MKINIKVLSTVFLFGVLSQPTQLAELDFRNLLVPVKIYLDKQSPAYIAWEDANSTPRNLEINISQNINLNNEIEPLLVGKPLIKKIKTVQLQIMLAQKTDNQPSLDKQLLASVPIQLRPVVINKYTQITEPTSEVRQIALADDKQILDYKTLAQELVDEELERRSLLNDKLKEIPSSRGGSIIVSGGFDTKKSSDAEKIKFVVASTKPKTPQAVTEKRTEREVARNNKKIVIAGFTGLSNGAAFFDNRHTINAYHIVDGKTYAHTKVNSTDGSYQIETDIDAGEIMAELVSPNGEVIAMGSRPLVLSQSKKTNEYLLNLELHPVANALMARVVFGSLEPSKTAEAATLMVNGLERRIAYNSESKLWTDKSFMAGSELVLKAMQQNHVPTIRLSKVGREQAVKVYPITYIETLKEIVFGKDNLSKYETSASVIGSITSRGFPVAGAKFSILGEDAAAVYYNGYIPDKKLETTSQNGEFAFAALSAEDKVLNIKMGEYSIWPMMISTYSRTVTQLDIEIETPIDSTWRSFDAFTGIPVPTVFSSLGAELSFATDANGMASKSISVSSGLSFAESDSNPEYLSIRAQINPGQSEINIPQFKTTWLNKFLIDHKLSEEYKKRILIGRVLGDDFDVIVNSEVAKNNIFYFNAAGQKVNSGENEGGFIIVGLEHGINTIGILPDKSKQIYTRQVYIDPYAAHYVPFNLNY